MSDRVLRLCLLAYPRELRGRDGEELLALAAELADDHGTTREALGLLRGGWAERRRRASRGRRAALALTAATAVTLGALTWSAAASPGRVEEERYGCSTDCAGVQREVDRRVDDGWTCDRSTTAAAAATVGWRCTLD